MSIYDFDNLFSPVTIIFLIVSGSAYEKEKLIKNINKIVMSVLKKKFRLRDYWEVATKCGVRLWMFEEKNKISKNKWFVHGNFC